MLCIIHITLLTSNTLLWKRMLFRLFLCLIAGLLIFRSSKAETTNQVQSNDLQQTTNSSNVPLNTTPDLTFGYPAENMEWGDLDADGDLDLAAIEGSFIRVYLNEKGVLHIQSHWTFDDPSGELRDLSLGDIDNDGDLDLVVGYTGIDAIYKNENGKLQSEAIQFSPDDEETKSIALGDMDGDGYLDLAVGNDAYGSNKVYLNKNGTLQSSAIWTVTTGQETTSIAWGDVDGDTYLDLAIGYDDAQPVIYKNNAGQLDTSPYWTATDNTSNYGITTSLAWGDMDGDGDLDLAVGNKYAAKVYINLNGNLKFTPDWVSSDIDPNSSIAWGDVDGDGDLDLAVGNASDSYRNSFNKIYLNTNGLLHTSPAWVSEEMSWASDIAWVDVDGDGNIDLTVANSSTSYQIYRNNATIIGTQDVKIFEHSPVYISSVALGDVDNDSDLDLAIGTSEDIAIHLNNNQEIELEPVWRSQASTDASSLAWGDVDGDGDLDLVTGKQSGATQLFINQNGMLESPPKTLFEDDGRVLAWGDVDSDGDLDLAAAGGPARVYLNEWGTIPDTPAWNSESIACPCGFASEDVGWGDVDSDGDIDLALGGLRRTELYTNLNGNLQKPVAWLSHEENQALISAIAWGDVDSDGDSDLATGIWGNTRLFLNNGGNLQNPPVWTSMDGDTTKLIWSDIDSDADLDLIAGYMGGYMTLDKKSHVKVFVNRNQILYSEPAEDICGNYNPHYLCTRVDSLAIGDIDLDGDMDLVLAGGTSVKLLFNSRIPQSSSHNKNLAVALGILSEPAATFSGQSTTQLAPANFYATTAIREGIIPINYWLYHPSSHPVATVRLYYSLNGGGAWREAVPATNTILSNLATAPYPTRSSINQHTFYWDVNASGFYGQSDNVVVRLVALPSLKPIPNGVAGFFQQPYAATQSYPFRVRGNQVRVVKETGVPISNSLIYRIPASQPNQSQIVGSGNENFRTSLKGYLQGHVELKTGDRLLALQPIHEAENYTLYQTSASSTIQGIDDFQITAGGVQTLTVSAANPLILFDLNVSLEWQEGTDTPFLNNLRRDLIESSKSLYDWSNGQIALGKVTVYQGREHWDDAHIQILASNQVRPSANRGGIVTDTTILTHTLLTEPITATRGIVRIGPTWTRYGDSDPNYVYDWQRVLAHELGHYLLFLEDTYLGLDETSGLLIPVDTCANTAMSDPYEEAGTEFRYNDELWQAECGHTLAELPDWDLIRLAYPALHAPPPVNPGPGTMPFLFTKVEIKPPPAGASPLANPLISFGNASSTLLNGRVYLRRPNQQLLDLGKYLGNELLVRGGQEGDELCIFAATAYACSYLSNSQPANFVTRPLWTPMIAVTPTSTTTLTIFVDQTAGSQVSATIYSDGAAPQTVLLAPGNPQSITLTQPAVEALVEITGAAEGERFITGYALGSGPGRLRSFDGPGRLRSFDGPVSSGDGSVVLYPPLALEKDTFISLQLATILPPLPIGVTPIGRPYYVRPSGEIADYAGGSIAFQYLGRDVAQQYIPEENLAVYYWTGSIWRRLPTIRNTAQNIASAPLQGPGLYMLSGFQTSLNGPGWNLVGYPLPYSLPITQALSPLEGFYRMVYDYDATNPVDPWRIFSVGTPSWVNDLSELKPNRGYWIYATENISWTVPTQAIASAATANQFLYPPAVYYGWITPTVDFTPTVGMQVRAEIEGILCGTSTVQSLDGKLAYVIKVAANDGLTNPPTCGAIGKTIVFTVDNWQMAHDVAWDNTRMTLHSFTQVTEIPTPTPINTPTFIPTPSSTPVPGETATVTPVVTPTPVLEESSIIGQDKVQVYLPLVSR